MLIPLVFFIVAINGIITLHGVIDPIINRYFNKEFNYDDWFWSDPQSVSKIYDYHGMGLSSWFGFKHWFYPWKEPTMVAKNIRLIKG